MANHLPLIGRADLVTQVLDRLQRPTDLRQRPHDFIQPGFWAMSGMGKTRLLQEIADRARTITPYVVTVDFDTRRTVHPPGTPMAVLKTIIEQLETLDQAQSSWLQRHRWKAQNPFQRCHEVLATPAPVINQQLIETHSSTVQHITMKISSQELVPTALEAALKEALTHLHHLVPIIEKFGGYAGKQIKPRPLVLVLFDTLEMASQMVRK